MEQRRWSAGVSADAAKGRAGNPAFEQSQQYLFDQLAAAGLSPRFETFADSSTGWEQVTGTLRLGGPAGEVLLSRDSHRVALAINSLRVPVHREHSFRFNVNTDSGHREHGFRPS